MIRRYFSAGNTPHGFVNYFSESMNMERASQILYIKGGSGIGKSTLMRKLVDKAVALNKDVTAIHCSSDKNSLDGVIVGGVAMFDATMPHIADPLYPRVNGRIVDLGVYLDAHKLIAKKADIIACVHDKKACYRDMYALLSTLNGVCATLMSFVDIDRVGTKRVAHEIYSAIENEHAEGVQGFLSLIDSEGLIDATDGIIDGRKVYAISSSVSYASAQVVDEISRMMMPTPHAKYHSLLMPNIVETIGADRSIVTSSKSVRYDVLYDIDSLINIKNTHAYNILIQYIDNVVAEASSLIKRAQLFHQSLEAIYASAMDYEALERAQNEIVDDITSMI